MNFAGVPEVIDCSDVSRIDEQVESAPRGAAVFAVFAREGQPYISRTKLLQRRLKRLLREGSGTRGLNLRSICRRVEYWPLASSLEGSLVLWEVAREHLPDTYLDLLHLKMPAYVKLVTTNEFPRTQVTSRIAVSPGQYVGPFRTRASAEHFEHAFLDLFQIRRCQEDLSPGPEHPGCIYGEMSMCLRPCQQVVSPPEYQSEVERVAEFLRTGGKALLAGAESARDRLSAELQYEDAAREHKRIERIQQVRSLRDELAGDIDEMYGVAVTASVRQGWVALWFVVKGVLLPQRELCVALEGQSLSMDRRLRDLASTLEAPQVTMKERQEQLAILSRWFYSSWRDGEWIAFEAPDKMPYRKLVGAISRTADRSATET